MTTYSKTGAIIGRPKSTLKRDIVADGLWVYDQLSNPRYERPPNLGAKGLLDWAREYPKEFYKEIFTKVLSEQNRRRAIQEKKKAEAKAAREAAQANKQVSEGTYEAIRQFLSQ